VLLVHWATVTFSTAFSHWYLDPDDGFYKVSLNVATVVTDPPASH
jgi:hypothetical protein